MGRKGIGKLSIFRSLERRNIHRGRQRSNGFPDGPRNHSQSDLRKPPDTYKPDALATWPSELTKGTRIVLSALSKNLSGMTVEGLKRRVARRFAVIGPTYDFKVLVNGNEIGPKKGIQVDHNALEYVWTYGDQSNFVITCKHLSRPEEKRLPAIQAELTKGGIDLSGWIGTVSNPSQLKDEDGDNLNRLAVFMRGKMAQEDILDDFAQKEIYADYVIGELHCEELDSNDPGRHCNY